MPRNGHSPPEKGGKTSTATHSFPVTIFANRFAMVRPRQEHMTLDGLRDFVLGKQKRTKDRLPLIKLASFGDIVTEEGCFRSDANVTKVFGAEADYDRELITFGQFVAKLRKLKIRTLVYTSPSCTAARPRVRIILPFKKPLRRNQFHQRAIFLSRIDGLFGGNVFGNESWTLSQTYYTGRDLSNKDADFRAVVIGGDYIDERPDLKRFEAISVTARQKAMQAYAETMRAKTGNLMVRRNSINRNGERNSYQRHGDKLYGDALDVLACMDYRERHGGKGIHRTQRDVSYQLIALGMSDDEVIEWIMAATLAIPEAAKWNHAGWRKRIEKLCRGAHRRLERERQEMLSMAVQDDRKKLSFEQHRARQQEQLANVLGRK